jgi:hypothetical protein
MKGTFLAMALAAAPSRFPSSAVWAAALLVLSCLHAAASIYKYEVTGTFPSNATTTAYSAPNEPFEYQFSLEPRTLNFIGVHSKIRLDAEISYFLNGQIAAEISGPVSFSVGTTVIGTGTHLIIPDGVSPDFPATFQGWFPGNPFNADSPRLYSYTLSVEPTIEVVPTLYTGIFNVINENDGPFTDAFFGATVGQWQISDAMVRVSLVPEASSLVSVALGSILAISLWALRRRYRRT